MLLIAQPKSASTSLVHALGEITGKPSLRQDRLSVKKGKAAGFNFLPHTDLIELTRRRLWLWINENKYYQQHIAPTDHNLSLLKKEGSCVVTLRDPHESFDAYMRQPDLQAFFKSLSRRNGKGSLAKAKKQLITLHERYVALCHHRNYLGIRFNDLVNNHAQMVNTVLEFYGESHRVDKSYQLPQFRFTDGGKKDYKYESTRRTDKK